MLVDLRVGPQVGLDGSSVLGGRADRQGSAVVTDAHGRYTEAVFRGNVFTASAQAGVAVTNLVAVATGLILTNPVNSGVNLAILEALFAQTSAAGVATAAVVLAAGLLSPTAVVQTAALAVRSALIGSAKVSAALAASSATLPAAPVVVRSLWAPSVSATATTAIPPVVKDEIAGALMLAPGTSLSFSATTALSGIGTFTWEEIPV